MRTKDKNKRKKYIYIEEAARSREIGIRSHQSVFVPATEEEIKGEKATYWPLFILRQAFAKVPSPPPARPPRIFHLAATTSRSRNVSHPFKYIDTLSPPRIIFFSVMLPLA